MKNRGILVVIALIMVCFFPQMIEAGTTEESKETLTEFFKGKRQQDVSDFDGGPEATQRVPISNVVLQQRYPETVVLQGPTNANRIALTFDDGPDPRFTGQVLDVLKELNVPATFFVMGNRAEQHPELVQRMVNEGHIVGNHSYSHPNFVQEGDVALLEQQVKQTEEVLNGIIGYRPRLFRAPYGFLYNELVEKLAELNYTVVGWSIDTLDWRERPAEEIAFTVISNAQPGSIVLMHDGAEAEGDRSGTIEALKQMIPTLQQQGFEFVTVSELLSIPFSQ